MAYMTQLADGRVVPQTTLPEHLWKGKPLKSDKAARPARPAKQRSDMSDKEKMDKLTALAQTIAVLGSGSKITREMSEIAHEVTGLGTGR